MTSRFLLFSIICLSSIQTFAAGVVKLSGKITHPLADSVSVNYDNGGLVYEPQTVAAALGKDGTFSLSFPVEQNFTSVYFNHGTQLTELMVQPGANLALTLDGNNFDSSIHYEGKGNVLANFMAKHTLQVSTMVDFTGRLYQQIGKNTADFEKAVQQEQTVEYNFYQKNSAGLPAEFASYWQNYFKYAGYKAMLDYPTLHEMQVQHSYSIKGDIPLQNYDILASVPMTFSDSFVNIAPYTQYVQSYFYNKLAAARYNNITFEKDKQYRQDDSLPSLVYLNAPPKTAEIVVANFIYSRSEHTEVERNDALLASYKKHFPASKNTKQLEQRINMLKRLATGQPAPDFKFKTLDGRNMKLSDLKGKVVLLDFWASWCGPCMAQAPSAKKLEEQFAGKDVAFLYVSIDEDDGNWQKAIQKNELKGLQTRVNGDWKAEAAQLYGVNGVPSYFLIDKKGKIGPRNLPRPDESDLLKNEIEKLLQ